jgi:hypothetical protein
MKISIKQLWLLLTQFNDSFLQDDVLPLLLLHWGAKKLYVILHV